jgi:phosphopantetheinyl transferase (holo-ACP synthase)
MVALAFPSLLEIYLVPRLGLGEPVVYAAVEAGDGARELVAARLLEALAGLAPEWTGAREWGPLTLDNGPLGQPLLRLGDQPGPGLSFSEAGGLLWAALTSKGQVGIDAAREEDLTPPYPYSRAFRLEEWEWAWRHCQGRAASAAALLWAAKEAAVKALGVGFHTIAPLDLEVAPLSPAWEGLNLTVQAHVAVSAWARPLADGWVSLAVA